MVHSERSNQYASGDYQGLASMNWKGYDYDNAVLERFVYSLHVEQANVCRIREVVKADTFDSIYIC